MAEKHKQQIEQYLKHHNLELTFERKVMIGVIAHMDAFDFRAFSQEAAYHDISKRTIYRFKDILIEAKILLPEESKPVRFNDNEADYHEAVSGMPRKIIENNTVMARVSRSHC